MYATQQQRPAKEDRIVSVSADSVDLEVAILIPIYREWKGLTCSRDAALAALNKLCSGTQVPDDIFEVDGKLNLAKLCEKLGIRTGILETPLDFNTAPEVGEMNQLTPPESSTGGSNSPQMGQPMPHGHQMPAQEYQQGAYFPPQPSVRQEFSGTCTGNVSMPFINQVTNYPAFPGQYLALNQPTNGNPGSFWPSNSRLQAQYLQHLAMQAPHQPGYGSTGFQGQSNGQFFGQEPNNNMNPAFQQQAHGNIGSAAPSNGQSSVQQPAEDTIEAGNDHTIDNTGSSGPSNDQSTEQEPNDTTFQTYDDPEFDFPSFDIPLHFRSNIDNANDTSMPASNGQANADTVSHTPADGQIEDVEGSFKHDSGSNMPSSQQNQSQLGSQQNWGNAPLDTVSMPQLELSRNQSPEFDERDVDQALRRWKEMEKRKRKGRNA